MTQDLKAQILKSINGMREWLDENAHVDDSYNFEKASYEFLEPCRELLTDPNVFVGRWETDMSKAPRDGTSILIFYPVVINSEVSGWTVIAHWNEWAWFRFNSDIFPTTPHTPIAWAHLLPQPQVTKTQEIVTCDETTNTDDHIANAGKMVCEPKQNTPAPLSTMGNLASLNEQAERHDDDERGNILKENDDDF